MQPDDWEKSLARTVGVYVNGEGIRERDARGRAVVDLNFLLYFNADADDFQVTLPPPEFSAKWEVVIDTAGDGADPAPPAAGSRLRIAGRSLVVLRAHQDQAEPEFTVAASLAAQTASAQEG